MWPATSLFVCLFLLSLTHPSLFAVSVFPSLFYYIELSLPSARDSGDGRTQLCVPFQLHLPKQFDCAGCLVHQSGLQISQPHSDAPEFHSTGSRTHFLVMFISHKENLRPRKYGLPESLNRGRHIYRLL